MVRLVLLACYRRLRLYLIDPIVDLVEMMLLIPFLIFVVSARVVFVRELLAFLCRLVCCCLCLVCRLRFLGMNFVLRCYSILFGVVCRLGVLRDIGLA